VVVASIVVVGTTVLVEAVGDGVAVVASNVVVGATVVVS
jgi:hypothetical protein